MPEEKAEAPQSSPSSSEERLRANYEGVARVLEGSARGRWFLAEHARRSRAAETASLLEAIVKLELTVLRSERKQSDQVLAGLVEMSEAIARTRAEIAAIKPTDQLNAASTELEHIVAATEKATSAILAAAEEVQEAGWILREKGADPTLCDVLYARATDIYTTCSFQDLTGQRTEKVVKVLRFIEQRVDAMIAIWDADDAGLQANHPPQPIAGPPEPLQHRTALVQGDIDAMLGSSEPAPAPPHDAPMPTGCAFTRTDDRDSQATLSHLSPPERAALFG